MNGGDDFDLEISISVFNLMVGIGWQLPDDALVRLWVAASRSVGEGEAHCGPAEPGYHPLTDSHRLHYQHLVVRAGPWEFYPEVTFRRRCDNYPGLRVRIGSLREAYRTLALVGTDLRAMEALGPQNGASDEPVKVRFGRSAVTVRLWDAQLDLEGE